MSDSGDLDKTKKRIEQLEKQVLEQEKIIESYSEQLKEDQKEDQKVNHVKEILHMAQGARQSFRTCSKVNYSSGVVECFGEVYSTADTIVNYIDKIKNSPWFDDVFIGCVAVGMAILTVYGLVTYARDTADKELQSAKKKQSK